MVTWVKITIVVWNSCFVVSPAGLRQRFLHIQDFYKHLMFVFSVHTVAFSDFIHASFFLFTVCDNSLLYNHGCVLKQADFSKSICPPNLPLNHGWPFLVLKGGCTSRFSFGPNQTHLKVISKSSCSLGFDFSGVFVWGWSWTLQGNGPPKPGMPTPI